MPTTTAAPDDRDGVAGAGRAAEDRARTVTIGRQRLRVAVRPGDGTRVPLLLINGIGASLELLDPVVAGLDPAVEVVRFDPPAIGGSSTPTLPYSFLHLGHLLGRLMTSLGHPRFDVLGISWGGAVAQQLALQLQGRVRRLVLVSTGYGSLMVPASPQVLSRLLTSRRYTDARYAETIAPMLYGGTTRDHPELAGMLHDGGPSGDRVGYLYQLLAGWAWSSLPFLPLLRAPTLILAGDDDPIIPLVNGQVMARLIPRASLHVYEGGHLALLTEPEVLVPVVDRFLAY